MDREVPPRPVLRLLGCLCFACFVLASRRTSLVNRP